MHAANDHDDDYYLRLKQVLKIIPVSRSTWYRGMKAGIYPEPVRLSHRVAAWKVSEVRQCLARLNSAGSLPQVFTEVSVSAHAGSAGQDAASNARLLQ